MNPVSHLLTGWVVANTADLTTRDRVVITLAGIAPDIDGLGIVAEILTENTTSPLLWYSKYHHVLCHNLGFGLLLVVTTVFISVRRWMTAFLVMVVFHLHLLGDLVGSRGPDNYQWPIYQIQHTGSYTPIKSPGQAGSSVTGHCDEIGIFF